MKKSIHEFGIRFNAHMYTIEIVTLDFTNMINQIKINFGEIRVKNLRAY